MGDRGEVANTGPAAAERGTKLTEKGAGPSDHKQPHGYNFESKTENEAAETKSNTFGGDPHVVGSGTPAKMAHGYGHSIMERKGPLRLSGTKGAHRVGKR